MSSVLSQTQFVGLMDKLFRSFSASQSKISTMLVLLFTCLSAWVAGELLWHFSGETTVIPKWSAQTIKSSTQSSSAAYDTSELTDAALFGRYSVEVKKAQVAPVVQDAPKTRLNLVLVGVVSSTASENGLAVIANRGKQSTYGIGEKIEGTQVVLKSVLVDRVIIENAGRDETLMLEGVEYKKLSSIASGKRPVSNVSSRQVGNNPAPSSSELENIRAEILQDPQKILQYIRLSQVKKDGRLLGYRVRPGAKRKLFDSVGLKNGDIATALNGEDLTNPATMGKIWQSIGELTDFNLTVERDGQVHDIYIAF